MSTAAIAQKFTSSLVSQSGVTSGGSSPFATSSDKRGFLPFSFSGTLRGSQENCSPQGTSAAQLPDLSRLNLGKLKLPRTPSRPALIENKKPTSPANLSPLKKNSSTPQKIDLLSCLKASSPNPSLSALSAGHNPVTSSRESTLFNGISVPAQRSFLPPSKTLSELLPTVSSSPPKDRSASSVDLTCSSTEHLLVGPMDEELPVGEEVETAAPSGFGRVLGSRWKSSRPARVPRGIGALREFLSSRYAHFDPQVPTAHELVVMEEHRRLQKDWKKEVERSKAKQSSREESSGKAANLNSKTSAPNNPFVDRNPYRFQFSGSS